MIVRIKTMGTRSTNNTEAGVDNKQKQQTDLYESCIQVACKEG